MAIGGCTNVRITDGYIDGAAMAGIAMTIEEFWKNGGTSDVWISNVHIKSANFIAPTEDWGAIYVRNDRNAHDMNRVYIGDITIHDTDPDATSQIRLIRSGTGLVGGIVLGPMMFTGTGSTTKITVSGAVDYVADWSITRLFTDTTNNPSLQLLNRPGATNYFTVAASNAGNPTLNVAGTSTDISAVYMPKGNDSALIYYANAGSRARLISDGSATDVDWNLENKGAGRVKENGNIVVSFVAVPSTATSTGKQGQMAADASFLYICYATNSWRRVAVASW